MTLPERVGKYQIAFFGASIVLSAAQPHPFPRGGRWREAPDEECGRSGMILHSVKTCDILPISKSDTLTNL